MPSGGRRLPPWTSPRGAAPRWSPCTPAGADGSGRAAHATPPASGGCSSHVTPPASGGGGCYGYRVTPPTSGGCSRPPRAPLSSVDSPYVRAKQAQVIGIRKPSCAMQFRLLWREVAN